MKRCGPHFLGATLVCALVLAGCRGAGEGKRAEAERETSAEQQDASSTATPSAPPPSPSPSPSPVPGDDDARAPVALGRVLPSPGATVREASVLDFQVAVHHVVDGEAGPSFERRSVDRTRRELTVLETDARGAVTRARVRYLERSLSRSQGGELATEQSPVVGQVYEVAARPDEPLLEVRYADAPQAEPPTAADEAPLEATDDEVDADGVPPAPRGPSAAELEAVRLDNRGLGEPDALRELLPTTPLQPGVPVALAEGAVARVFAQSAGRRVRVEQATVELREVVAREGHPVAVLGAALRLKLEDEDEPGAEAATSAQGEQRSSSMLLVLEGELTVQLTTGWIESLQLAGPVETAGTQLGADGTLLRMSGSGRLEMRYEAEYAPR